MRTYGIIHPGELLLPSIGLLLTDRCLPAHLPYQHVGGYFTKLTRDRPDRKKKAIVATARKILTICFAILRDGQPFDPDRVAPAAVAVTA